jgi:hypothetical protein
MKRIAGIPRRALVASAVVILALVCVHRPAAAVTLRDVAQAANDWRTLPASAPGEPGAVLAALARVDTLPLRCGTPLLMTLSGQPENASLMAALQPARGLLEERSLATRDGRFVVRTTPPGIGAAARDAEAGAETVARILDALVSSRASLLAQGWPEPAPERIAVVVTRIGHGLDGYVLPGRPGAHAASAVMVLDAALPPERIATAVLHQVAHLSLLTFAHGAPWWHEATAGYLALLGGTGSFDRASLASRLETTARGIDSDDLAVLPGALLWPLFLTERTGDALLVRQVWQALGDQILDPLAAADEVLKRRGLSLGAAVREMAVWNQFTGARSDARHYEIGPDLPEGALADLGPDLPLSVSSPEPVEPTGSLAYRLSAGNARGALRLAVSAEGGAPAADVLLFSRSHDALPVLVPVPLVGGRGETSIPWTDAREAWIVLRNAPEPGEAGASRFDLSLDVDPRAPFDLAAFATTQVGRSLVLEWTTASESGLLGWNVYRSESPDGPYVRLNSVALPAYGDGAADTGYLFVDDGARPGRRYYYQVEGVTASGLAQRSHTASARVNP